ncbi:MAG: hypothetical protein AMXMBFR84_06150 [Candidatus Hydrogenedentota bacterium]
MPSHGPEFMTQIVVLFGTALVTAWLFRLVHAPSIIGYLFTGIVLGPSALGLITSDGVGELSEIGLILLLFIVGLELSPRPLVRLGASILVATGLQIGITAGGAGAVAWGLGGLSPSASLIVGIVVALSSTAIVLKQLSDRGETNTVNGIITTAILLLQDIIVIVVMLFVPLLAAAGSGNLGETLGTTLISLAGVVAAALGARKVLPLFLNKVVRSGGSELMALFAVMMAFGGAWLGGLAGWSPALGACVAGLLLAEADERHQLAADIMPFRDVFNAIFFITLGVMVDVHLVLPHLGLLAIAVLATLAAKTIITTFAVMACRWPLRPALQVGLGLCTVSEFGYVLANEAAKAGVLPEGVLEIVIAYAVGTMMIGAALVPLSGPVAEAIANRLPGKTREPDREDSLAATSQSHHVIIVGYGLTGENMHKVLAATRIPHCVIEMNARLIAEARADGADVIMGDASRMAILRHAGIGHAHAMVIAINDPQGTRSIVAKARTTRPDIFILARTRFVEELDGLYRLGANQVIPEDFETSVEIAANILKEMDIPDNIVDAQIAAIRAGRYGMLRGLASDRNAQEELIRVLNLTATRSHYLQEGKAACGNSILSLNLRAVTGVTIIAIMRGSKPIISPDPDFVLTAGDVLIMVGSHAQLEAAKVFLESPA